jgi:hypothetical protein
MTGNLGENKKEPHKKIATAEERKEVLVKKNDNKCIPSRERCGVS